MIVETPVVSSEDIDKAIFSSFPMKDENGKPLFRSGQYECIRSTIEECVAGGKFVAIEGPTGCGKSVINYTVLRSIGKLIKNRGRLIYCTPQKILQDQVGAEKWEGVAVLKGASGYSCNVCQGFDEVKYKCDYEGPDVKTCNNSDDKIPRDDMMIDMVAYSISRQLESGVEPGIMKQKTSFDDIDDFWKVYEKSKELHLRTYLYQTSLPDEDRMNKYKGKSHEFVDHEMIERQAFLDISCSMKPIECPRNSARAKANISEVIVMNPDILYYINQNEFSKYSNISALVIDECHGFDGVIKRIFEDSIPIDILKEYGIDFGDAYFMSKSGKYLESTRSFEHVVKTRVGKIMCTLDAVSAAAGFITVHNKDTYDSNTSTTKMAGLFAKEFREECIVGRFSVLDAMDDAVNGVGPIELITEVKAILDNSKFAEFGTTSIRDLKASVLNMVSRKVLEELIHERSLLAAGKKKQYMKVSLDAVVYDYLDMLKGILSKFIKSVSFMMSNDNQKYILSAETTDRKFVVKKKYGCHFAEKHDERILKLIVVKPGDVANMVFYSKSSSVIMSTGTWIYPESMYKTLGVNSNSVKLIKIPSSFKKELRPIYVVSDRNLTDYSSKSGGEFDYKTELGTRKFVNETVNMVNWVRNDIMSKYKIQPNIIVHCHSFDIARRIAEYGHIDDRWIINLSEKNPYVVNRNSGIYVNGVDKISMMNTVGSNPDSGLVIVSPSVTEGVDFRDGLARAQIILKHPIPNIMDPYISSIMKGISEIELEKDSNALSRMIYTTIVQQYGRVMRSPSDWGITYILDQRTVADINEMVNGSRKWQKSRMNADYLFDGLKTVHIGGKSLFIDPRIK